MTTLEVKQTIIYLSPTDAEAYKLFMQNYTNFSFLISKGAFDKQPGHVAFDRDPNGVIINMSVTNNFKRMSN